MNQSIFTRAGIEMMAQCWALIHREIDQFVFEIPNRCAYVEPYANLRCCMPDGHPPFKGIRHVYDRPSIPPWNLGLCGMFSMDLIAKVQTQHFGPSEFQRVWERMYLNRPWPSRYEQEYPMVRGDYVVEQQPGSRIEFLEIDMLITREGARLLRKDDLIEDARKWEAIPDAPNFDDPGVSFTKASGEVVTIPKGTRR